MRTVIYGWTNTKQFYLAEVNEGHTRQIPEYLHLTYHQEKMTEEKRKYLDDYMNMKMNFDKKITLENVHAVTASALFQSDEDLIAFGLKDGTVSVWNHIAHNL